MDAFFLMFQVLGGCTLEVSIVKVMWKSEQHVNFVGSREYSPDHYIYFGLALFPFALGLLGVII